MNSRRFVGSDKSAPSAGIGAANESASQTQATWKRSSRRAGERDGARGQPQMRKDPSNHGWLFDGGDDLQLAAAVPMPISVGTRRLSGHVRHSPRPGDIGARREKGGLNFLFALAGHRANCCHQTAAAGAGFWGYASRPSPAPQCARRTCGPSYDGLLRGTTRDVQSENIFSTHWNMRGSPCACLGHQPGVRR